MDSAEAGDNIRVRKGFGFWVAKAGNPPVVYLIRCFDCGKENYAPAVASGTCAWCHYDANKDPEVQAGPPKPAQAS